MKDSQLYFEFFDFDSFVHNVKIFLNTAIMFFKYRESNVIVFHNLLLHEKM